MDLQFTKRQKKGYEDVNTVPLERHIEIKRKQLVENRLEVPNMRIMSSNLRKEAATMTKRWQIRLVKEKLLEADVIDEEADIRESMNREHEYEKLVAGYLQLYHKRVEVGLNPNSCRKKETIDAYMKQADLTTQRQSTLVHEYLADVGESAPRVAMNTRDECPYCYTKMLLVSTKSIMTCTECGYSMSYLDASTASTSYDDSVEFSVFAYKRVNHFLSWIQHVQGKESFEVPEEVLHQVMEEMYQQRMTLNEINTKRTRIILKTLKLRKYYDNVAQITSRIIGKPPPRISSDTEEVLKRMFLKMQPAFEAHAPKNRKNFLSYSYVLYRFFQILKLDHMLVGLTLLKGSEKLKLQNDVFAKICVALEWDFDPHKA